MQTVKAGTSLVAGGCRQCPMSHACTWSNLALLVCFVSNVNNGVEHFCFVPSNAWLWPEVLHASAPESGTTKDPVPRGWAQLQHQLRRSAVPLITAREPWNGYLWR